MPPPDDVFMWLKEAIQELKADLKDTRRDVSSMKVTLAENHQGWLEHMRRTEANEEQLALFKAESDLRDHHLRSELEPLKTHVHRWAGVGKALSVLATLVGVLAGLWRFFR